MQNKTPRILILGGGFAGIYTALEFEKVLAHGFDAEVILVSSQDHFLFTPMLHEVVSGDLRDDNITIPIRKILKNIRFVHADVLSVDLVKQFLKINNGELFYDYVILALGAVPNFFEMDHVAQKALPMKKAGDAVKIRAQIEACFKKASVESDEDTQKKLLTFVVAGGGFTGVETIGAISDFAQRMLKVYSSISSDLIKICLIHPGSEIVPEMSSKMGLYAKKNFEKRNIKIKLQASVVDFSEQGVCLNDGEIIFAETMVWAAGNKASPVVESLDLPKEKGRIIVDEYFQVKGFPSVWAIGDCAFVPDKKRGGSHPPTAQHAVREAKAMAQNLIATIKEKPKKIFYFDTLGQIANIGGRRGIATVLGFDVTGILAWILWHIVYLLKLPTSGKKIKVLGRWIFH
ncbi:MAG: NAD(P)/FAD-dependent oxidoreductase [Candidatus Omnitrophica bacterium]|nr:NAD(P)/FAD-dependent oxidoreductase [Candidatus Omnitrophota bacterium]